jgi:hypothetical protein
MGLVAKVSCRCFVEGKTQPPVSVSVGVAEDGSRYLDLPSKGNEETQVLFSAWCASACAHRGMVYEAEVINWGAYRSFQQALAEAGWEHFPTMKAELPQSNGGVTSSSAAVQMLAELMFFSEQADLGQVTVLVDSDTGEELHQYIAVYGGEFHYGSSGDNFGVDDAGFFIRRSVGQTAQEVFRALRVKQILPDSNEIAKGGQPLVTFENLDSGVRYACAEPLVKIVYWPNGALQNAEGQIHFGYPNNVHVLTRKRVAADFEAVVHSLRTICEAAVQIGNPIAW